MLIKIRVYDTKLKTWVSGYPIASLDEHNLFMDFNGDLQNRCGGPVDKGRFAIQICTTRIDRNGIDLYDGDVVKIPSCNWNGCCRIGWDYKGSCWGLYRIVRVNNDPRRICVEKEYVNDLFECKRLSLRGNIFEGWKEYKRDGYRY